MEVALNYRSLPALAITDWIPDAYVCTMSDGESAMSIKSVRYLVDYETRSPSSRI